MAGQSLGQLWTNKVVPGKEQQPKQGEAPLVNTDVKTSFKQGILNQIAKPAIGQQPGIPQ